MLERYRHGLYKAQESTISTKFMHRVLEMKFQDRVSSFSQIDDCVKNGGKEFFTKMQCVLLSNSYAIVKDS